MPDPERGQVVRARHFIRSLVLVHPRNTRPDMTEFSLTGREESTQINKANPDPLPTPPPPPAVRGFPRT